MINFEYACDRCQKASLEASQNYWPISVWLLQDRWDGPSGSLGLSALMTLGTYLAESMGEYVWGV